MNGFAYRPITLLKRISKIRSNLPSIAKNVNIWYKRVKIGIPKKKLAVLDSKFKPQEYYNARIRTKTGVKKKYFRSTTLRMK